MRTAALLIVGGVALAACSKGGGSAPLGAPALKLGPKDGQWSQHQALAGPMAVWGAPELGKEAVSVTCQTAPSKTLVVALFAPALPSRKPPTGELTARVDGKAVSVPLSPKEDGAEARLPAGAAVSDSWAKAKSLRFEVKSNPGDGADTGAPTEPLKQVLDACR